MDTHSQSRWSTLLRTTRNMIVIVLGLAVLHGMFVPLKTAAAREALLDRLQAQRGARVIAMIHRQDTVSLFGIPVSSSIGIEDSEAILRAIRLTPADQPVLARFMRGLLYGVQPGDPGTLASVAAGALLTALLAAILPAWRAARIDPASALRYE